MYRLLIYLLIGIFGLAAIAALSFGPLFLQDTPSVAASSPPAPEDVAAARQFVRDVRAAAGNGTNSEKDLWVSEDQLDSIVRLGGRFVRGFRGRVITAEDSVRGQVSLPVRWWGGQKWLNLAGEVPAFEGTFIFGRVSVGAQEIPSGLALFAARWGANLIVGNRIGDRVLDSASAMSITPDGLMFHIALDRVGQNGVMRDVFGSIRGSTMPTPGEIETYHLLIRDAMASGVLPRSGSFVHYLDFALQTALARSTAETLPNEYTAAVFGLAKACGALDLAMIVGRLAFDATEEKREWATNCEEITLNGRIDSRRHFITSAALQAASNSGVAISLGEFKELYDTISGAGGFDFTDMAANLSGVRLSNVLMALPQEAWPARLALLETESDFIVSFDGIPQLMPEAEFKARFGTVDSPAYKAMLARIEARNDDLRLYQGL